MRKTYQSMLFCVAILLINACSKSDKPDDSEPPPQSEIKSPPAALALNSFYKKYVDAGGVPVVSSDKVPDQALLNSKTIILHMLKNLSPAAKSKMAEYKLRVGIMAKSEKPTQLPEYSDLYTAFPGTDWDNRARAYGATLQRPLTATCEENALCQMGDWYKGEEILTHEFSHAIHELGLRYANASFDNDLTAAFNNAKSKGLWANTYAMTDAREYWAEGVQDWFNCNLQASPADGVHNYVNTRAELKTYDVDLYNLIKQFFADDDVRHGCY